MKDDGKLTYYMRWVAGVTSILIAYGSAKLSVAGIGLGGDLWWLNWVIAVSLFVAEFMVNGRHTELNWMIWVVGAGAYAYSIATNIIGIGDYMTKDGSVLSGMSLITMYAGGVFMDIYPELVLRWALRESKVGDFLGNLIKTVNDPQILTKSFTTSAPGYHVEQRRGNGSQRRKELQHQFHKKQIPLGEDMDEDDDDEPIRHSRPVRHHQFGGV